jgi:hypothetical protein
VDDIVDQLRNLASALKRNQGRSTVVAAADEIERLREESLNELLAASLESKSVRRSRKASNG